MPQLLNDQATDIETAPMAWAGGAGTIFVSGTFDMSQLVFECERYGDWVAVSHHSTFAAPGVEDFTLAACNLRFRLINAGSKTSINAGIETI